MCCGIALQCRRVLQCGFAVGCEDSEDTGFCPLRIIGCAPEQYMSQEMPNLRRFLARFMLCDNQMTIILSYLPKRIQVLFLSESSFFYNAEDIYQLVRNVEWYFHIAL